MKRTLAVIVLTLFFAVPAIAGEQLQVKHEGFLTCEPPEGKADRREKRPQRGADPGDDTRGGQVLTHGAPRVLGGPVPCPISCPIPWTGTQPGASL
jgi:hypothetical protein